MSLGNFFQLASLPEPAFPNQQFCGLVLLAPGISAHAYVPTYAEKYGDYSNFGSPLLDPLAGGQPFPGNILPMSQIPGIWGWRVADVGVISADVEVEIVNAASGKVLDVRDVSTENAAPIQQWDYLGGGNQKWKMIPVDVVYSNFGSPVYPLNAIYFKFQSVLTGKVLNVADASSEEGARIQQYDFLGGENQKWQLVPVDAIHYKIVNKLSAKVLDVRDYSLSNGAELQPWDYLGGDNQKWQLVPIIHFTLQNQLSGKVLDVPNFSTANGAAIQQWDNLNGANQQWLVVPVDGQYVKIENVLSHKVLDVTDVSPDDGALIEQWDYLGGDNQKWQIISTGGNTVKIANKFSGKVLDVVDDSTAAGAHLQQWDFLNEASQQWSLFGTYVRN